MNRIKYSKLFAYILAVVVFIQALPLHTLTPLYAKTLATISLRVVQEADLANTFTQTEGATLKLTNKEDQTKVVETTIDQGIATFHDLEANATYTVELSHLYGYSLVTQEVSIDSQQTSTNVVIKPLAKLTLSGTVNNQEHLPYEGAEIIASGYGMEVTTTSDRNGSYQLSLYEGRTYQITIKPKKGDEFLKELTKTVTMNTAQALDYSFTMKMWNVTVTNNTVGLGNVSVDKIEQIPYGESRSVTFTANALHRIKEIRVNGEVQANVMGEKTYTLHLTNIKEDINVEVSFYKVDTVRVIFEVDQNGTIVYKNPTNIDEVSGEIIGGTITAKAIETEKNSNLEISAIAKEHYHISRFEVNGQNVELQHPKEYVHTLNNITSTTQVRVEFALNKYNVSIKYPKGLQGNVSLSTSETQMGNPLSKTLEVNANEHVFVHIKDAGQYNVRLKDGTQLKEANGGGFVSDGILVVKNLELELVTSLKEEVSVSDAYTIYDTQNNPIQGVFVNDTLYFKKDTAIVLRPNAPYVKMKLANQWFSRNSYRTTLGKNEEAIQVREVIDANRSRFQIVPQVVITYDQDAPTLNDIRYSEQGVTVGNKEWFAKAPTISFTVEDAKSQVDCVLYAKSANGTYTPLTEVDGRYRFKVDEETFSGFYYVKTKDRCGNEKVYEIAVNVDQSKPQVTSMKVSSNNKIKYDTEATKSKSDVTLTIQASDIGSGVKEVDLYVGDQLNTATKYRTSSFKQGRAQFTLAKSDFKTKKFIYVVVKDEMGNESEKTMLTMNPEIKSDFVWISDGQITNQIEVSKPDYVNKQQAWYGKDIDFVLQVADRKEGLDTVEIYLNNQLITTNHKGEVLDLNYRDEASTILEDTIVVNSKQAVKEGLNTLEVRITNTLDVTKTFTKQVYIDRIHPTITQFEIAKLHTSTLANALHILTLGTFFKEQVVVKVSSEDGSDASGVKEIALLVNNEEYARTQVDAKSNASFTLPKELLGEDFCFTGELSAIAYDHVNHQTKEATLPNSSNSNMHNGVVVLENRKPKIHVNYETPRDDFNKNTSDHKEWYKQDVAFQVCVEDQDSGLGSVSIALNNQELVKENFEQLDHKLESKTYEVNTNMVAYEEDGSYQLQVVVVDRAGNKKRYEHTIYRDRYAPSISTIQFIGQRKPQPTVVKTDYGYFFKEDTTVCIQANDPHPSSGLHSISYYTIDVTNNKNGVKSKELRKMVDANGKISFVIPANFKGQVFAKAQDNVGNVQEHFVTPNALVVENEQQHKLEEHITLELMDTTNQTNTGSKLYHKDVNVLIKVKDSYSGIEKVSYSVMAPYDTSKNQSQEVVVSSDSKLALQQVKQAGWNVLKKDRNLVTEMEKAITVTNNSNDIVVRVTMQDRSGHISSKDLSFSIDKTNPIITIDYDKKEVCDPYHVTYFSSDRNARITIKERNFNAKDIVYAITNTDQVIPNVDLTNEKVWKKIEQKQNPDETVYVADIHYHADGDYTFDLRYQDRAKNKANPIAQQKFTIDQTKPKVSVSYDCMAAVNGNYYNTARTASIVIKEHTFDPSRVQVVANATLDGKVIAYPTMSSFQNIAKDTYRATITYQNDGTYVFDIECKDKANNAITDFTPQEFHIDQTKPTIEISGVANHSANKGALRPIVTFHDVNFDASKANITLVGAKRKNIVLEGSYQDIKNGKRFTFKNFANKKNIDDIYTLHVRVVDQANNITTKQVVFSINRFGSTYLIDDANKQLNGSYVQKGSNVVIHEINANRLHNMQVTLFKNNQTMKLKEGVDYRIDVHGGNGSWYEYTYTIFKKCFSEDGVYRLSLYSEDEAGNISENTLDTKQVSMQFGVDSTKPNVVIHNLESNTTYALDRKKVTMSLSDNLLLSKVEVYLDDYKKPYKTWDAKEIARILDHSDAFVFAINGDKKSSHRLRVVCIDAAGNKQEVEVTNFYVTTDAWVRFVTNKPLFYGTLIALLVLFGWFLFFVLKKKEEEEQEK